VSHVSLTDREALRLLGSGHEYLILTVLEGEVPAMVGDGGLGIAPVLPLNPEVWIEKEKQDHVLAERRIRETLSELGPDVEIRPTYFTQVARPCIWTLVDGVQMGSPHTSLRCRGLCGRAGSKGGSKRRSKMISGMAAPSLG
jgi:hypothetical protein